MDALSIAAVVRKEIERQQANVDYDAMSEEELAQVIESLKSRLDLCNAVIESRTSGAAPAAAAVPAAVPELTSEGDAPVKKEAPKMVAKKVEGSWPELPWGGTS